MKAQHQRSPAIAHREPSPKPVVMAANPPLLGSASASSQLPHLRNRRHAVGRGRALNCGRKSCYAARWKAILFVILAIASMPGALPAARNSPVKVPLSLLPTLQSSVLHDLNHGPLLIRGEAPGIPRVVLRVTTSLGLSAQSAVPVKEGRFAVAYPTGFPGAPPITPGVLFVDACPAETPTTNGSGLFQAEMAVIIYDRAARTLPCLPTAFMNDLLDRAGNRDTRCVEWPVMRSLVNLYLRSRGARLAGIGRTEFDLNRPADLAWFKRNLGIYDFDHRDRDWTSPLGHRVARTFWQAAWDSWFNNSNNHPWDGNPSNRAPDNFVPYTFANDFADLLLVYLMQRQIPRPMDDNLETICLEGTANLLAMQHRDPTNFALVDRRGRREISGPGAFRYGMFVNGEYLTEGRGWFYNTNHLDYANGGVFNGRATWALGEAFRGASARQASELRQALVLALRFCLLDSQKSGYAKTTRAGRAYWRDAGEHAYLVLGMIEACATAPNMEVPLGKNGSRISLAQATADALNALVDLEKPHHQWAVYPDVDSVAVTALARGAAVPPLHSHPDAPRWRRVATRVADAWMAARVDPAEYPPPVIHFGLRTQPEVMTFKWSHLAPHLSKRNTIYLYQTGHWIRALANLYTLTGESRYRDRAQAMIAYLCGANPWHVRLLNELGGVYNWVEDMDGDGTEDWLKQDMYPESTAYCQLGILHFLAGSIAR